MAIEPAANRLEPAANRLEPAANRVRTVACLGASLTAGTISFNYLELLEKNPALAGIRFCNHGVNGDLAWNALQRLDAVIADQPDAVAIMVGTNDVNCTVSERNRFRYIEFNKLPITHPDLAWYEENLRVMVVRLQNEAGAKIALLSLPMIGEDLAHEANQKLAPYNEAIRRVADDLGATYLPLHERMIVYLHDHEADRASLPPRLEYRDGLTNINAAIALHQQGLSWDEISRHNGLLLTTDTLHLNGVAGAMVAEFVAGWLLDK